MSKAHNRQHHSHPMPHAPAAPVWDRIPHKAVIFSLLLAAIPFATGKYLEFNTGGAFDSGAYMYSAHRVLDGAIPWVTESVTAKAGTLLANMVGISLFGYHDYSAKIIQMLLQIAALATMFFVMRKVFGTLAAGVSLVVASFYLSAPVIAKFGNVKEQYAIAFMILGISMLLMRQMGGRWFWGLLAGGFLAWGPMFKETGASAIIAAFIFLFLQPLLKNRTWKLAGADFGLMILGGFIFIAPVSLWVHHIKAPAVFNPYVLTSKAVYYKAANAISRITQPAPAPAPRSLTDPNAASQASTPAADSPVAAPDDYLFGAWRYVNVAEVSHRILRWYLVVMLPIAFALSAIVIRIARLVLSLLKRHSMADTKPYERFALLLGLWWLIDMALVWVSPRPWEEYFLPLCASGAMAGGYLVALYRDKLRATAERAFWISFGVAGLVCMVIMSWHIVFGLRTSPFSGGRYDRPANGYLQRLAEIKGTSPWEAAAVYIRDHSGPQDKIYVWGWYPGIYVMAGRDSACPAMPFTSESHVLSPRGLASAARSLVESFEREKPRFIVDTRKNDFPFTRFPLEFWSFVPGRTFLPNDPAVVRAYEPQWRQLIKDMAMRRETATVGPEKAASFGEEEAQRYDAMKLVRDYVMANYHIVSPETYRPIESADLTVGRFGAHVLFERNDAAR